MALLLLAQAFMAVVTAQGPGPPRKKIPPQILGIAPAPQPVPPPATPPATPAALPEGPILIDFEDQTTGGPGEGGHVVLTDQYAAKGVSFNRVVVIDYSKGLALPNFAHGTRAIEQCFGLESCQNPIAATFAVSQGRVKVWAGYSARHDAGAIVFIARDPSGQEIDRRTLAVPAAAAPAALEPLEIVDARASIASIEVSGQGDVRPSGLAIDDLEFERQLQVAPIPGAPPDGTVPPAPVSFDLSLGTPSASSAAQPVVVVPITVSGVSSTATTMRADAMGWGSLEIAVPPMEPGEQTVQFTLPANLLPGTYRVTFTLEQPQGQTETTLANNSATIDVQVPRPPSRLPFYLAVGGVLLVILLSVVAFTRPKRQPDTAEDATSRADGAKPPHVVFKPCADRGTSEVRSGRGLGNFDVRIRVSPGLSTQRTIAGHSSEETQR